MAVAAIVAAAALAPLPARVLQRQASPARMCATPPPPTDTGAQSTRRVLWAEGLSRANDGKDFQFREVSLNLLEGQRAGLVGANGCGKSTLLRTLAGLESPDAGRVETARGASVIYVEQEPPLRGRTVREAVYLGVGGDGALAADQGLRAAFEYHKAARRAAEDPEAFERAAAAAADAWGHDARALAVCDRLGISGILDKDVAACSGGERKRAGLAAALAREPDVLLVDEPTNHLDARGIRFLAEALSRPASNRRQPAVLCVSHDRAFLERVCGGLLFELDAGALHAYRWNGRYATFLDLKDARMAADQGVADRARAQLRTEREWMRRQPKARESKSRAREERFYALEEAAAAGPSAGGGADVAGLGRPAARLGSLVLRLEGATVAGGAGGKPLVENLDLELEPGSRWGIVGDNGCGKTTLLAAIVGAAPLAAGTRIVGSTVRVGYYDQRGLEGDPALGTLAPDGLEAVRVLEFAARCVDLAWRETGDDSLLQAGSPEGTARRLLKLLRFPQDRWGALVARLSGGERRRLQLLRVLSSAPNLLLLDEATNDLDLPTIAALEQWLADQFSGALLAVSHDEMFLQRTCTDGVLAILGEGQARKFPSYAEYEAHVAAEEERRRGAGEEERAAVAPPALRSAAPERPKVKLSYKEARELEGIEDEVTELQRDLAAAEAEVEAACADGRPFDEVADLTARAAELSAALERREERWMELLELADEVEKAAAAKAAAP